MFHLHDTLHAVQKKRKRGRHDYFHWETIFPSLTTWSGHISSLEIVKGWRKWFTSCKSFLNECKTSSRVSLVESANYLVSEAFWRYQDSNSLWVDVRLPHIHVRAWFFFAATFTRWVTWSARYLTRLRGKQSISRPDKRDIIFLYFLQVFISLNLQITNTLLQPLFLNTMSLEPKSLLVARFAKG